MAGLINNIQKIKEELSGRAEIVAASKARAAGEILEAIEGGITIIGENYIQEAEEKFNAIGKKVKWHLIGSLQKNKVKRAVRIFDMIETVDSFEIADAIDRACAGTGRVMPVLIEINSGKEKNKSGVMPEEAEELVKRILELKNIKIEGLMTMGPLLLAAEDYRPYFKNTKQLFDKIKSSADMKYLSMGMSGSYRVAAQEGANLVRIGTAIFGPRP